MQFRKKSVVIEAFRNEWNEAPLPAWWREYCDGHQVSFLNGDIYLHTLEGTMRANRGDWIIRGVKGEVYPCKPDIFEATYDPVDAS